MLMPAVMVVAEQTGFIVPLNDPAALRAKLEWLRDHPSEARMLGVAGRRRVCDQFTWPAIVRGCLDAYAGPDGFGE
jgi:glycosyltransferase involved in cell wall biosynthesis